MGVSQSEWDRPMVRAAIVAGSRTPLARAGGVLRHMHVCELAARSMQETLFRAEWAANRVDEIILGNVVMPADATNPARVAGLYANLPDDVPAVTVQRNCASGAEAIWQAAVKIQSNQARVVLAGGAESMSSIPLLFPQETLEPMAAMQRGRGMGKVKAATRLRPRHFKPVAGLQLGLTDPSCEMIMGQTAEVLAHEFGVSRSEQDAFSLRSHQRVAAASEAGYLSDETFTVYSGDAFEPVSEDVGPRANQSIEALGKLKPIFDRRDGTVTVGNVCQVTDGAATVLVMNERLARAEGLPILGYVSAYTCMALEPTHMGLGPVFAIARLLDQCGLEAGDIDLFEINEAFAAQVLACVTAMQSSQFARTNLGSNKPVMEVDMQRLNVNGGAIALGHPVGATGARLVLTLLMQMQRQQVERGIAAMCVGGGQGAAMLLERG